MVDVDEVAAIALLEICEREEARRALRRERVVRDRSNAFELHDESFRLLYRVNKGIVMRLCDELRDVLPPPSRRSAMTVETRVLAAMRFFATGGYQRGIGEESTVGLSQMSISRAVTSVARAMSTHLLQHWVKFAQNADEIVKVKQGFMRRFNFPGVIGAVDGTHIAIVAPPINDQENREGAYVNRKGFHSINAQIVCNADMKITSVCARYPGSSHDAFVWKFCRLRTMVEEAHTQGVLSGWLLGDKGYPLEPWLMTPIEGELDEMTAEARYNVAHQKARNIIERCVGLLKARWRCILKHRVLHYDPRMAADIFNACAILHMCLHEDLPEPEEVEEAGPEEVGAEQDDAAGNVRGNALAALGQRIQQQLLRTF